MRAINVKPAPAPPHIQSSPWSAISSAASSQMELLGDAWGAISRSWSSLIDTLLPPATGTLEPRKIKTVPDAAFEQFQQTLQSQGCRKLPYCPRQYFNDYGERYVLSRSYIFGAYGRVHIGIRSQDGCRVAVKELPIEHQWTPSQGPKTPNPHHKIEAGVDVTPVKQASTLAKVHEELELAAQAGDKPLDTFMYNGRMFIVTELLAGDVLDAVSTLHPAGSIEDRRDMAMALMGVAHPMKKVHAKGIVHRDLKLENILRSAGGTFHITDWGCALPLTFNASTISACTGTLGAVPLEVLLGCKTDHRFDVFSLAVQMVTAALGCRLFNIHDFKKSHQDMESFESWLDEIRCIATGEIDLGKLTMSTGRWAETTADLMTVLGDELALFVINHMLTGNLDRRATMEEVAHAFDAYVLATHPSAPERAMDICAGLAAVDKEREALLQGLEMFDKAFPAMPSDM